MTLENLLMPATYDFREEILPFSPLDDVFVRYAAYLAHDHIHDKKDNNVRLAARKIAEAYPKKRTHYGQGEADSCILIHEVYQHLWEPVYLGPCWKNQETKLLAGDTMNSINTTINCLIETKLGRDETSDQLKKLRAIEKKKNIRFYYEENARNKKYEYKWGKPRSILLYHYDPKWFKELLEPAKDFLSVAYTIGNFIPCPVGCNQPRGFNNRTVEDYWDLTLWYVYCWYHDKSDAHLKKIVKENFEQYKKWLKSFTDEETGLPSWDVFIEANYLQNFTERDTRPYGRPEEFWDKHFSGSALPETQEQIETFFAHATECIKARSKRMVDALREHSQNQ